MTRLRRFHLWLPPLLVMGVIFALSAVPHLNSGLGVFDLIGRKFVHFAEYALLTFLWWRALRPHTSPARAALAAFVIASGYAVTDELHQSFVAGRAARPLDWAIDSAGAGLVALRLRTVRGARR